MLDCSDFLLNRILGTLIVILFVPGIYLTLADLLPAPHQEDFGAYYLAALALAGGESPFDANVASRLANAAGVDSHSPYIYPPLLAVVIRPLTALPYRVAALVWILMSAAALFAALWLLRPVVQIPWRIYGWVCAAALFLPSAHHTLQHGQITNLLLLLIVVGVLGSGPAGAVWLGVASALKVFPATLAVVYALSGRAAALAVMAGSAAILTLTGAIAAPAATADFMQRVGPQLAADRRLAPNNQSVFAVLARLFEAQWFVRPIVDAPAAGLVASYVAVAVVTGLTVSTLWSIRRATDPMADVARMSLALAATLIVSPIVWDHYYVLLLLPAAVLYRASGEPAVMTQLLAGAVLLLSHRYWPLMTSMKSPLFMSSGLAGVTVLWIALLKVVRYDRVCVARTSPSAVSRSTT